jgi:hypothetical protein
MPDGEQKDAVPDGEQEDADQEGRPARLLGGGVPVPCLAGSPARQWPGGCSAILQTSSSVALDLHRRTANQVSDTKVSASSSLVERDGTEDEDDEWHLIGDCRRRLTPDPAVDLRPIGTKSKFCISVAIHARFGASSSCSWFLQDTVVRGGDGFARLVGSLAGRSIYVSGFNGHEGRVGKKHREGLDGCMVHDDVAVVREVAAVKDIAGGDCAVTDTCGWRSVARGTLTEVLGETSSVAPATWKTTGIGGEDRQRLLRFQNLSDPNLMPEKRPPPPIHNARRDGWASGRGPTWALYTEQPGTQQMLRCQISGSIFTRQV